MYLRLVYDHPRFGRFKVPIARIIKEYVIKKSESLVLLNIEDNEIHKEYVTIIIHSPSGEITSYRATEYVDDKTKDSVWLKRTMFNGRHIEELIYPKKSAKLDPKQIIFVKEVVIEDPIKSNSLRGLDTAKKLNYYDDPFGKFEVKSNIGTVHLDNNTLTTLESLDISSQNIMVDEYSGTTMAIDPGGLVDFNKLPPLPSADNLFPIHEYSINIDANTGSITTIITDNSTIIDILNT